MSNLAKLKKRAAEYEQKKDLDKALELYQRALDDAGKEIDDSDVPLYNRVGDLLMRQGQVADALGYYERAVDLYAERGFLNNAIALCNKILRQSPGRTAVYYKLGRISASKGFKSDARKNFLEYAERMQKTGSLDEAFRALKEFASLFPDQDDIRLILADQLSKENRKGEALEQLHALYQKLESEGRRAEARATIDRMKAIDPEASPQADAPAAKPNDLVFLDLSEQDHKRTPPATPRKEDEAAPTSTLHSNVPALEGLSLTFVPGQNETGKRPVARVPGFEPTAAEDDGQRPERTGEFEVVAEPVPVEFDGERGVTASGGRAGQVGADAPPAIDLNAEEQSALSGVEFAELELSEVTRRTGARTHDLALPSALPLLDNSAASKTGAREPATPRQVSPTSGSGLAGLAKDLEAAEPTAHKTAPSRRHSEDLLSGKPSFGEGGATGHVFPPIAGLSDEHAAIASRTPDQGGTRIGDATRDPGPNEPDGDVQEFLATPPQQVERESPTSKVDAPLPAGFETRPRSVEPPPRQGTPRAVVTLGGAEAQLRSRIELDPQNWALRRQLGEAFLDAGNREAGLQELELAMMGLERAGDLIGAQEISDEIIRVAPTSVRHHQKRVEYAVRAKDRARLIDAYLELGDALFRIGQGDKSVAVYARVLELAPDNERAMFALSTLAPDHLARTRGGAARHGRWSDELEAIPEGGNFTYTQPAAETQRKPERSPPREPAPTTRDRHADFAPRAPQIAVPDEKAQKIAAKESQPAPAARNGGGPGSAAPSAPPPASREHAQIVNRAQSLTPSSGSDADFVDLGEWLRLDEPEKSTRLVVEDTKPSGDEEADFQDLLRAFKRGVAENMDAEDYEAHYDLGVAYKEMGLTDEAIAEFQKALRGGTNLVRSYEALGQCFVEKMQYSIAAALLQRAVETPGTDDQQLVGVLYLLGFAHEQMGRHAEALSYYQRVFAVDLEFRDIMHRVSAMEQLAK